MVNMLLGLGILAGFLLVVGIGWICIRAMSNWLD